MTANLEFDEDRSQAEDTQDHRSEFQRKPAQGATRFRSVSSTAKILHGFLHNRVRLITINWNIEQR